MQLLEVAGVLAFVLLFIALIQDPVRRLHKSQPAAAQLVFGFGVGVLTAALALVFTLDVFPDDLEPISRIVLLVGVGIEAIIVWFREVR
jgi:multisubunit Na+/H+ antiporter MnhB subunit